MEFYRYGWGVVSHASLDESGEYGNNNNIFDMFPDTRLELTTYKLIEETPKGYWIDHEWSNRKWKWISKTSRKRYAYPTKEEALKNFILRTEKRITYLQHDIISCKTALKLAKETTI